MTRFTNNLFNLYVDSWLRIVILKILFWKRKMKRIIKKSRSGIKFIIFFFLHSSISYEYKYNINLTLYIKIYLYKNKIYLGYLKYLIYLFKD